LRLWNRSISRELRLIDAFRTFLLGAVGHENRAGAAAGARVSWVSLLGELDEWTGTALKRLIADYVGLKHPISDEREALLRRALPHCGWAGREYEPGHLGFDRH